MSPLIKKILIGAAAFFGLLLVVIVGVSLYVGSLLNKDFVVQQIESYLNLRAEVEELNTGLFSAVSTIELRGVKLGPRDRYANAGTPLSERPPMQNALLSADAINLGLEVLPLLENRLVVEELVLTRPVVNLVIYANGGNNLGALFGTPKIVNGEPNPALNPEPAPEPAEGEEPDDGVFTASDIGLAGSLQRVGVDEGVLNLNMLSTGDKIIARNLDLFLTDIEVDPQNLKEKNSAYIRFDTDATLLNRAGQEKGVLLLESAGPIQPFEANSGAWNPALRYNIDVKEGSYISGFLLFESLAKEIPLVGLAGTQLDELSQRAELTETVGLELQYGGALLKLLDSPTFPTKNYNFSLQEGSQLMLGSNSHAFEGRMLASKEESARILEKIDAELQKALQGDAEQAKEIRNKLLSSLVEDDQVYLQFLSRGQLGNPNVSMLANIPDVTTLIRDAAGEIARQRLGNEVDKALDQNLGPAGQQVKNQLKKGLDSLF